LLVATAWLVAACGGGSDDNAAPTIDLARSGSGSAVVGTPLRLTGTAADGDGTVAKVEFFVDGNKVAEDATAPFEYDWMPTAVGTYALTARATDNGGATATSAAVPVPVSQPGNVPPSVTLADPIVSGPAPATLTLAAVASDSDGSVQGVEFFDGSTQLGAGTLRAGTADTWELVLPNRAAGALNVFARATDNANGATDTPVKSVTINEPSNVLPSVTMNAPAVTGLSPNATVTLSAQASDSDGSIQKVEFFNNGTALLGTVTLPKVGTSDVYELVLNNRSTGSLLVTARATDNRGGVSTTASALVTVNEAPAVTLAALPTTPLTAPASLTLSATATDNGGSIAKVEFFDGASLLGNGTLKSGATDTWELALSGLGAGTRSITARATDNAGAATTTPAQTLVVDASLLGPWASLSAAQKAGITKDPASSIGDASTVAVWTLSALGVNRIIPSLVPALDYGAVTLAKFLATASAGACPGGGTVAGGGAASPRWFTLTNCKIGNLTFNGGAAYQHPGVAAPTMVPSEAKYTQTAGGFDVELANVLVNIDGGPDTPAYPADIPRNAMTWKVSCTGATPSCVLVPAGTPPNDRCTLYGLCNEWGTNLSWTDYLAGPSVNEIHDDSYVVSGTRYSKQYAESRTMIFDALRHQGSNLSGRVVVYGSGGGFAEVRPYQYLTAGLPRYEQTDTEASCKPGQGGLGPAVMKIDPNEQPPTGELREFYRDYADMDTRLTVRLNGGSLQNVQCGVWKCKGDWTCRPL
jgi:hypothetical protein